MFALLLLFLRVGNIATSAASSGVNLDCTNNYERLMSCHFDAPNCTDYNVTLWSLDGFGEKYCLPVLCASGKCCCSINMYLILYENHLASVFRGDKYVESRNISIKFGLKPNAPTIVSVKESHGNVRVAWMPNIEKAHIREQTRTNVTYRKKGDTKEVSEMSAVTADGPSYLEILGDHVEPSTTYVFTAQNFLTWGSPPSDRSEEYEFTTPPARERLLVAVIISLSLVAVIATSGTYGCYVKCRAKYWDSVSDCQNSKLLDLNPSEQELLKPTPPIISSIYVEPSTPDDIKAWSKGSLCDSVVSLLQSSGIGSSPSSLSYTCTEAADIIKSVQEALSKALVNINPISQSTNYPLTSSLPATHPCCGEQCSGSYRCENKTTYSFIRPSCPPQIKTEQSQLCHSDYQEAGGASTCLNEALACEDIVLPTVVSSYTLTGESHQRGSGDSGRLSNFDASLSCSKTSLNGDVESRMGEGHGSCKEMFVGADDCILPISCNYQMFQGLRKDSDIAFADWKSSEKDQNLGKFLEKPLQTLEDASKAHSFVLAKSQDSLPINGNYQAFESLVKQPGIKTTDHASVENEEELKKILHQRVENVRKDDEAHSFMLERSQDRLLVDGDYQAFPSLVKQPGINIADQKSVEKNEDLKKILDERLENAREGDEAHSVMLSRSQDSLPVNTHYQAFQGNGRHYDPRERALPTVVSSYMMSDTSYQQSSRESGRLSNFDASLSCSKTSLNGDVESKMGEGHGSCKERFVGADEGSLPVSYNYQMFQGLRRHSDITFTDLKCSKKVEDWGSLEKQSKDASEDDKAHSFMLARSQDSLPVDANYQAFQGLVKKPDTKSPDQKSVRKEGVFEKFPEKTLESPTKRDLAHGSILARSHDSFPVDAHYQAFGALGKHSGPVVPVSLDQSYRCLPEPQEPFLPFLVFADQQHEIVTESGYKIV